MGLAASQARALLLVARKSDLEYRSQCISQRKIVLSQQTEQLAKDYNTKISNRKLRFVYNLDGNSSTSMYEDLSYYSLSAENPKFVGSYRVLNNRGDIVVASYKDIPKTEVKVYQFAKKAENSESAALVTKKSYAESDEKLGTGESGKMTPLYILGHDKDGKEQYVQVQDENGIIKNQKTYKEQTVDGKTTWVEKAVTGESAITKDFEKAKLYTATDVEDYAETVYDNSLKDNPNYVCTGNFTTEKIDPVPMGDGEYYSADGRKYIICEDITQNNYFQNGLRTGAFILQKENLIEVTNDDGVKTGEYSTWESTPWQGIDVINDVLYTEDDALAESEYEAKTAVIKTQDQMLDLELKQIETQHKAIETEEESVKKVIQSNIEKTFKIFA